MKGTHRCAPRRDSFITADVIAAVATIVASLCSPLVSKILTGPIAAAFRLIRTSEVLSDGLNYLAS
jgi:hypothetical protein